MSHAIALVSVVLFAIAFRAAGVPRVAVTAIGSTRRTVAVLADRAQSEDAKERAARKAAISLFRYLAAITALTVLALVPTMLALACAMLLGITDQASLTEALLSPWIAVAGSAAFAAAFLVRR